jgi:hypothetical protein
VRTVERRLAITALPPAALHESGTTGLCASTGYNSLQRRAACCTVAQRDKARCNGLRSVSVRCAVMQRAVRRVTARCLVLQQRRTDRPVATCCNARLPLQRVALRRVAMRRALCCQRRTWMCTTTGSSPVPDPSSAPRRRPSPSADALAPARSDPRAAAGTSYARSGADPARHARAEPGKAHAQRRYSRRAQATPRTQGCDTG